MPSPSGISDDIIHRLYPIHPDEHPSRPAYRRTAHQFAGAALCSQRAPVPPLLQELRYQCSRLRTSVLSEQLADRVRPVNHTLPRITLEQHNTPERRALWERLDTTDFAPWTDMPSAIEALR